MCPNLISMKLGIIMGTTLRTFVSEPSFCSRTWTSPRSKSNSVPQITPATEPFPNDEESEEEVVVTDGPGGVADDPMNPQEQTNNPQE